MMTLVLLIQEKIINGKKLLLNLMFSITRNYIHFMKIYYFLFLIIFNIYIMFEK